ncbi:MAG: HRDC domain-containing protein, partial [Gemmatimonadota bacterium]
DGELQGYPRQERGGRGRMDPEVEDRMKRLKAVRNRKAEELGIARGTLFPNALLEAIAELVPGSVAEMEGVPGLQEWQREVLGPELMEEMQVAPVADAGR